MNDDIDRLKTVLENLRQVNDTLRDHYDVMRDVVNAVKPVELETDPEGHSALRDLAKEIDDEQDLLAFVTEKFEELVWKLEVKARAK